MLLFLQYSQHVFQPFLQQWSTNGPIEMGIIIKLCLTKFTPIPIYQDEYSVTEWVTPGLKRMKLIL